MNNTRGTFYVCTACNNGLQKYAHRYAVMYLHKLRCPIAVADGGDPCVMFDPTALAAVGDITIFSNEVQQLCVKHMVSVHRDSAAALAGGRIVW